MYSNYITINSEYGSCLVVNGCSKQDTSQIDIKSGLPSRRGLPDCVSRVDHIVYSDVTKLLSPNAHKPFYQTV